MRPMTKPIARNIFVFKLRRVTYNQCGQALTVGSLPTHPSPEMHMIIRVESTSRLSARFAHTYKAHRLMARLDLRFGIVEKFFDS